MSARVYVEGGGNGNKALKAECRQAFRTFFERAGLAGRLPRVVAGGGRQQTYDDFCTAFRKTGDDAFIVLLVDSEDAVRQGDSPWTHLRNREADGWRKPDGATDEQAHLMVQCMEAWFLADRPALAEYFGRGFRANVLPGQNNVEQVPKADVFAGLDSAVQGCGGRRRYTKGRDSFRILTSLEPARVAAGSSHAARLVATLRDRL